MDDFLHASTRELIIINHGTVRSSGSSPAWSVVCCFAVAYSIVLFKNHLYWFININIYEIYNVIVRHKFLQFVMKKMHDYSTCNKIL